MEEAEDGDASTPFWLQSRRNNTYFRRTASLGGRVSTVATQIFFAGAATILIVFFILPPFISSVSQFFRPHLVRKSWDYLNFVLVLFAVVCGFLSRNSTTGDDDVINRNKEDEITKNNRGRVSTPRYWMDDEFSEKRFSRIRSSSSYPDLKLREFETDQRWRFYDDTRVSTECRYEASDRIYPNQGYRNWREEVKPEEEEEEEEEDVDRTVAGDGDGGGDVEAVVTATDEVAEELPSVISNPPSKPGKRKKTKRVYQDVAPEEEKKETPIQPPASVYQKKKGGATKDFLIALRRKKKKQRQQSIDGLDLLFASDPPFAASPPPPPPPPPPFFQGLFSSKKGKSKRTYSNPPPPPPPPPPERRFESRASVTKIRKAPVESESRTSKPNPPAKVTQFVGIGNESPLMPIPPPPPPPPFKMPAWKYVKRGDYVRMASDISISSDEPDDDSDVGKAAGNTFCPSPDVDTKADDFIARFRAGLKLEKINSANRGRSNLGPEP